MARGEEAERERTIHDISPAIGVGTPVWPGDAHFALEWTWALSRGDSVSVAKLTLSPHTGAHADAPLHVAAGGAAAADLGLSPYWGRARVVDWRGRGPIDAAGVAEADWRGVTRALFRTRADGEPLRFDEAFCYFTASGAQALCRLGLVLVGIDTPSVDAFANSELSAHHAFFGGGAAVLESLELAHVPPGDYELVALPLRLVGADASPVRAVLRELS